MVTTPTRFDSRQRVILLVLLGAGFMLSVVRVRAARRQVHLVLFGRLADLVGRRRMLLAGLHLALGFNVVVTLACVALIGIRLRDVAQ